MRLSKYFLLCSFYILLSCGKDSTTTTTTPTTPTATCSDGIKNGTETGVDCGGTCNACPSAISRTDADLNKATIDFEESGTGPSLAIADKDGTWGVFGSKDSKDITIAYADNPAKGTENNSDKVFAITEPAGLEPWAGFFFDVASKIKFSGDNTAVSVQVRSVSKGQSVLLKLEDKSDNTKFKELTVKTTTDNAWETLTFNFSATDSDKYDRLVFIMNSIVSNSAEVIHHIDNIALAKPVVIDTGGSNAVAPTTAPTTPSQSASTVLSIFSDAYTDVANTDFNPNWGQATKFSVEKIADNNVIKYENLNYQGTAFAAPLDVSDKTKIHIDFFTGDATGANFYLISTGPAEKAYALPVTEKKGQWNSVDIDLSHFSDVVKLNDIIQFKVGEGSGTIYLDNIYFY